MLRYHDLYKAKSNEAYNDSASLYRDMLSNPIVYKTGKDSTVRLPPNALREKSHLVSPKGNTRFLNRIGFTRQQIDLVDRFIEREGGAEPVMCGLYVEVIQEAVATDGGQVTRAEVRGRPHHAPRAQGRHRHDPPRRHGHAHVAAPHGYEAPAHHVALQEALAAEHHKLIRPPRFASHPLAPPRTAGQSAVGFGRQENGVARKTMRATPLLFSLAETRLGGAQGRGGRQVGGRRAESQSWCSNPGPDARRPWRTRREPGQ